MFYLIYVYNIWTNIVISIIKSANFTHTRTLFCVVMNATLDKIAACNAKPWCWWFATAHMRTLCVTNLIYLRKGGRNEVLNMRLRYVFFFAFEPHIGKRISSLHICSTHIFGRLFVISEKMLFFFACVRRRRHSLQGIGNCLLNMRQHCHKASPMFLSLLHYSVYVSEGEWWFILRLRKRQDNVKGERFVLYIFFFL